MELLDIGSLQIGDRLVGTLRIGDATGDIPRHMLTGKKECGYIVRNTTIEPWYWENIIDRGDSRFLTFAYLPLMHIEEITATLRSQALSLIRALAQSIQKLPQDFIRSDRGFLEMWRVYYLQEGGFLFLPESLSQLFLYCASEEARYSAIGRYSKPNTEVPFALSHQCTQLLYLALTGKAPYEDAAIREDKWQHIPLSLGLSSIDTNVALWIDETLSMKPEEQRSNASAAYSGQENLNWFLEHTSSFTWDVDDQIIPIEELQTRNEKLKSFLESQEKRVKMKRFWRKRGALVVSISVGAIVLLSFVGNIIVKELQPPYTKGMSPIAVIEEFFVGQNELDSQKMTASFARRVKNPFEMEVTGLFVNSRVRQAYEGIQPVIRADEWVAAGKPPVPSSSIIYGVTSVDIALVDHNTYRAIYRQFSPSDHERDFEVDSAMYVDEIQRVTEFVLTDTKGYWQITSVRLLDSRLITTHRLESYEQEGSAGLGTIVAP